MHPLVPQGCAVAWEGAIRPQLWSVSVLDTGGATLVRLAAETQDGAERWLAALQAAGCARRDEMLRLKAPAQVSSVHNASVVYGYVMTCACATPVTAIRSWAY